MPDLLQVSHKEDRCFLHLLVHFCLVNLMGFLLLHVITLSFSSRLLYGYLECDINSLHFVCSLFSVFSKSYLSLDTCSYWYLGSTHGVTANSGILAL